MRLGVVAEGPSDFLVIEAVVRRLDPSVELELIQPGTTLVSGYPNGWRGVQAWCEENGPRLEAVMRGVKGRELDGLLIHTDCSMAHNVAARRPCPPCRDTVDALRAVVAGWLARKHLPGWIAIVTPAQMTDAWIVAALDDPPYEGLPDIECDLGAEDELARRRLLRRRDGQIKKPRVRYERLVASMIARWEAVRASCTIAALFEGEARGLLAVIASGGGATI